MAGGHNLEAGIYDEVPFDWDSGKQVYVHAEWRLDKKQLSFHYVGCGRMGRSSDISWRSRKVDHVAWLRRHWWPRTTLCIKPRRLERLTWLEEQFAEFGCPEGLVIFETPCLKNPERVEARLIEMYRQRGHLRFNRASGSPHVPRTWRAVPNVGCLRDHVVDIRRRRAEGESYGQLAQEFGVDRSSIRDVVNRRTYAHVP